MRFSLAPETGSIILRFPRDAKGRSPGRSGKFPGRQTGRRNSQETIAFQNTAIREDPGSFREEKREGRNRLSKNPQSGKIREDSGKASGNRCEHCKSRFEFVSSRFPSTRFPQSGPCLNFMVKSVHTGSHKCRFWPRRPRDPFFQGEKPCWRNRGSSTVSPARFWPCFQA